MFSALYVEEQIQFHPRVERIVSRYPGVPQIHIDRYTEIFNRKNQNFRLQKNKPALILAKKNQNHVLPAPESYGLGGTRNFYFSHMLNCIYDCRYCFLQGMYQSANYVLFVNYEDFIDQIEATIKSNSGEVCYFYSGYDCDSLALDPLSEFVKVYLPEFQKYHNAILELRTKSTQIRSLLDSEPQQNCVIAFSFTPKAVSVALEHKVPSIEKRIDAMRKLQDRGWNIGLRFDPVIYTDNFRDEYAELFQVIFSRLDNTKLHSVSLGVFRLPEPFFRKMQRLYPEEKLFSARITKSESMISYGRQLEEELIADCESMLLNHVSRDIYFPCRL